MTVQLLKKVAFSVAMLLSQTIISQAQDSEETLNQKYWNMRERFRKYYVSLGADKGQGIPVAKRQAGTYSGNNRCGTLHNTSSGWMSWGDATSYLGDYMCTLATEYALLAQEGKSTKATLNELYYALNALERLDGFAEKTFNISNAINYNGFFLRDDVEQSTVSKWNYEYNNVGVQDPLLNYRCVNTDHLSNLNDDLVLNQQGQRVPRGSVATNEPSFDQISNILTGFSFIKKYVPSVYVKPMPTDVGFNIIDKMQAITVRLMDYMSGADRQLQQADHASELMFNVLGHPTPAIFGPGTPLAFTLNSAVGYLVADSDCGNNDIRGNWILVNPVTGRKVGVESENTENQDIRFCAYAFAKIAEKLTGDNQYLNRSIHHVSVDHSGDQYYCLSKHDYRIPLSVVSSAWGMLENMTAVPEDLVFSFGGPPNNPGSTFKNTIAVKLNSVPRNFYIFECLGSTSGTWSHANVSKFASFYGHENLDLIYSCLNDKTPLISQQHYINLLSKMPCDGNRNYGQNDFTSFWNSGNSFEEPHYDNINTDTYGHGEYNANDWMWLYNMYRLKFGNAAFPKYEDVSCNCKKSPTLEANTNQQTGVLDTSITLKRLFKDYLKLGISLKEFNQGLLYVQNNITLTNETELTICGQVYVSGNGSIVNTGNATNADSIKITVRNNSGLFVQSNGLLDIGNNTKVIIQKGGQLISSGLNSRIIVRTGGKLIIEPGAFLELNNGSRLIVEDGGQVIIQTLIAPGGITSQNATLTYNQGAEIQLKGHNAVLEINGKLHIGDNAVFGFTYPGSNSGYILFNRGNNVWWDNWAPNNAHITCGNNAKINLVGQSKTDQLIVINQADVAIPKNLVQFTMSKGLVEFNATGARLETAVTTAFSQCTFHGFVSDVSANTRPTRGVFMFGQPAFLATNCDFKDLGCGITGVLFYGGYKLTGVSYCNFTNCHQGINTVGAGASIKNNTFNDNDNAISCSDVVSNSAVIKNKIQSSSIYSGALGIVTHGSNVVFEANKNVINSQAIACVATNLELKLKCNDLTYNTTALLGNTNSKINMSTLLGAGYNNASNCNLFAEFQEANTWEANGGFNSFDISDNSPCYNVISGPNHISTQHCPTITQGSLINFSNYNTSTNTYELAAEQNYWLNSSSTLFNIELDYNKIQKIIPATPSYNYPTFLPANVLSGNTLTDNTLVQCPTELSSGYPHLKLTHPLSAHSDCSYIVTPSFNNIRLQEALLGILENQMSDMADYNQINIAADLLTEILTANYTTPVVNHTDKYLLELAYQKLYVCIAQLVEMQRDSGKTMDEITSSLKNRFKKLHYINGVRLERKHTLDDDYNETINLIKLEDALVHRLEEKRSKALEILNIIISNNPKEQHANLYKHWYCLLSAEEDAINDVITMDEALSKIQECNLAYLLKNNGKKTGRLMVSSALSNESTNTNYEISVYPNPVKNNIIISYNLQQFSNPIFDVFDMHGKKVMSHYLNPENTTFNINDCDLQNGIYTYVISDNNKALFTKKLVVIKD